MPPIPMRAQRGHRQHDQRQQPDADGGAAERHRPPGGGHRPRHRVLAPAAGGQFLPPPGDQQQRVVDRHAQADQRGQVLHDDADRGDLGQAVEGGEAGRDRHRRHRQRHHRQRRAEHEQQHAQRRGPGQQRLGENPEPFPGLAAAGQLVHPGHRDTAARRQRGPHRGGDLRAQARRRQLPGVGGEHQPVAQPRVAGQEPAVAGAGVIGGPQARPRRDRGERRSPAPAARPRWPRPGRAAAAPRPLPGSRVRRCRSPAGSAGQPGSWPRPAARTGPTAAPTAAPRRPRQRPARPARTPRRPACDAARTATARP